MAWKLRKDKAQSGPTDEETGLTDTAVPEEKEEGASEAAPEPALQDFQSNPFVMAPADDELLPLGSEHPIVPPVFEEHAIAPPVFDFTPTSAPEPRFETTEPHFETAEPIVLAPEAPAEPIFSEDVSQGGPFAPFQPVTPEEEKAAPDAEAPAPAQALPESLGRDAVAPGLVHATSDMNVPRVAPFIVDLPPAEAASEPIAGTLAVRFGNFAASFQITKDVTLIGRPDSTLQAYPDVEIDLDDAVSRRHAEVRRRDGQYSVVDLRSTNGTLLNGQALEPGREYPLAHGDHIHVGDRTEIVFE